MRIPIVSTLAAAMLLVCLGAPNIAHAQKVDPVKAGPGVRFGLPELPQKDPEDRVPVKRDDKPGLGNDDFRGLGNEDFRLKGRSALDAAEHVPAGKGPEEGPKVKAPPNAKDIGSARTSVNMAETVLAICMKKAADAAKKDSNSDTHSPGFTGSGAGYDRDAKGSTDANADPCKGARDAYHEALAAYEDAVAKNLANRKDG